MDSGPPELLALNNDLILDLIFKNLSTSSLLSCRLVNKKWNKIGCDILRRRPIYLTISSWTENNFKELSKICSNLSFPVTGLKIDDDDEVCDVDISTVDQFFRDFGSGFTRVYLEYCKVKDYFGMMKLMVQCLPNLVEVDLKTIKIIDGGTEQERSVDADNLQMPNVLQINIRTYYSHWVVWYLVRASPNLKLINGMTSQIFSFFFEELNKRNKLGALGSLHLWIACNYTLEVYSKLALQPPALTDLCVNFHHGNKDSRKFQNFLKAVLIASGNTLKKLAVEPPMIPCNDPPLVFTKLHTLELGNYEERNERNFGNAEDEMVSGLLDVNPGERFPAVMRISLLLQQQREKDRSHLVTGTREMLQKYFWKPGTVWNTVDTLELHDHFSSDGMEYLAQVFPTVARVIINFAHAGFVDIEATQQKPSDVWFVRKFPNLRKLVILDFPAGSKNLSLDDFLTGIPKKIREGLLPNKKATTGQASQAYNDQLSRPYRGLWKLKDTGLRELEILFSESYPRGKYPRMSQQAVLYGLQVIPDLITTYKVPAKAKKDIVQAVEPLRPHVGVEYY